MKPKFVFLVLVTINVFLLCFLILTKKFWYMQDIHYERSLNLSVKTGENSEEIEKVEDHKKICNIPKLDPYAEYAQRIIANDEVGKNKLKCLDKAQQVRFQVDDVTSSLIQVEPNSPFWENLTCCYFGFVLEMENRNTTDRTNELCLHFRLNSDSGKIQILQIYDYVDVQCMSWDTLQMVYQDQFLFLRMDSKKEDLSNSKIRNRQRDTLNFILIGLDSVSHVNFLRFMPKTRSYLLDSMSAIEFWGRNIVSGGTQGNLLATLTGCRLSTKDYSSPESYTEDCSLIWSRFAEQGYRTFRSEDDEGCDKHFFPALKENETGSSETDYNWINYIYEMKRRNEAKGEHLKTFGCFDHQWVQYLILDRVAKIARYYGRPDNRNKPYFNFMWSGTTTHEVIGYTRFFDEPFLALFKELHETKLLDNTALIFISDHGVNYGTYSRTYDGSTEFRMPFLYFVLPEWFRTKYALATKNLGKNSHRLSTPYDLHETMLDLLDPEKRIAKQQAVPTRSSKNRHGISLFQPIPLNRTCVTAEIPTQYCICHLKTHVENPYGNSDVVRIADRLLAYLNERLEKFKECDRLRKDRIVLARVSQFRSSRVNSSVAQVNVYDVQVQTMLPQQGIFETTATIDSAKGSVVTISGRVIRVNAYGDQSSCLDIYDDSEVAWLRSVCYCNERFRSRNFGLSLNTSASSFLLWISLLFYVMS